MSKFPQCHRQPGDLRKHFERSVPSVKDHSAIFNIFEKFYENGPCIQAISFGVTSKKCNSEKWSYPGQSKKRNLQQKDFQTHKKFQNFFHISSTNPQNKFNCPRIFKNLQSLLIIIFNC